MTPAARYAAAITILDHIAAGQAAEPAIAGWGRQNRFAGSKDRAAVRDHVFDVLRMRRSCAAWGGGTTGRALVLGLLRQQEVALDSVFGAGGYAPDALTAEELSAPPALTDAEAADLPDWLWPVWTSSLGDAATEVAAIQRARAAVFLRVNLRRGSRDAARASLAEEGIATEPHDAVATCLEVTGNPRRVAQSRAYAEGLVEVQDTASQAAMAALGPVTGRALDFCAGGGGKALALADMYDVAVTAHDVAPQRMKDLPARAGRAGVSVPLVDTRDLRGETFDLVLCDAPCSGSGTWRRTPEAKWALTPERLGALQKIQKEVLREGAALVAPGGRLAYATCSVFELENANIINDFCDDVPGWSATHVQHWLPSRGNDGFFLAVLLRS